MREVVNSAMLINMLEKATAADQIVQLQQRVGCLQTEREQLRQRVAESEDQREAVFSSLKQTVVDAQNEIQVKRDQCPSESDTVIYRHYSNAATATTVIQLLIIVPGIYQW